MNTATGAGINVRTGFKNPSDWTTNGVSSADTCFGWSSNNPGDLSRVGYWGGTANIADIRGLIDAGQLGCNFAGRLICVEQ